MKYSKYLLLLAVATLLWQCEPAVDDFKPSAGEADFTTFVAIGDSYSAGYVDGALSYEGQIASFPNIIATQLKSVGFVSAFKQPLVPEGTSVGSAGNGSYVLRVVNNSITPVATIGNPELLANPANWVNAQAPFNNVAVPGAKSIHLVAAGYGNPAAGSGNFNPFFSRFAANPTTSSVFGDAMLAQPTFVSILIGGNDVLAYALAGGEGNTAGNGSTDITATSTFEYVINTMFSTLKTAGIKGVTGSLADINALPYFAYVPYNGLALTADSAATLNTYYTSYNTNAQAKGLPIISFTAGRNAFVVEDKQGYPRHATPSDRILLSALNVKTKGWGSSTYIGKQYVLDVNEINAITSATETFNSILKAKAEMYGFAFADLNQLMKDLVVTKIIDGNSYSSTFVTGGVFSLDGIHSTPRGSAIIANEYIKAINAKYNASVPVVNINDFRMNIFP